MNLWFFVYFIWIVAQMLSLVSESASAFTSTPLVGRITPTDRFIPIRSAVDMPEAGNRFTIDVEEISYVRIVSQAQCGRYQAVPVSYQYECLDTGAAGAGRGVGDSVPASHSVGALVVSDATNALSQISQIRVVEVETGWGPLAFPVQAFSAITSFFGSMVSWDYDYLDGPGWYLKIFLHGLNAVVAIGLVRIFIGPMSAMIGGIGRGVGRLFGV